MTNARVLLQLLMLASVVGQSLASWAEWNGWSPCDVTCGIGKRRRSRLCMSDSTHCCSEDEVSAHGSEVEDCRGQKCKDNAGYHPWHEWTACTSYCEEGTHFRYRVCKRNKCRGPAQETGTCSDVPNCKGIDGSWSSWEGWSGCSATCGQGYRYRKRSCNNPVPRYNGSHCPGSSFESLPCLADPKQCAVNGAWSSWEGWSACSATCGQGYHYRKRSCNNPEPRNNGSPCHGQGYQYHRCLGDHMECIVNGSWTSWTAWSACSATCGQGYHYRKRSCNNPEPSNNGSLCHGRNFENLPCFPDLKECRVDGSWSSWEEWSTCSATCGQGYHYRKRSCNTPEPSYNGSPCPGSHFESRGCSADPMKCIVHGSWSTWGDWSACSATCGQGYRYRKRLCNNPKPQNNGFLCKGSSFESLPCLVNPRQCVVIPGFGPWTDWSGWKRRPGGKIRTRSRACDNPPSESNAECNGDKDQQEKRAGARG